MSVTISNGGAGSGGMVPQNMDQAMRLADMMARGKMMPEHLRNPGDALMVIEQAMRWNMSPFAVAQSTYNIKGKLLFSGTIVAAAIENSGAIAGLMDYQFSGEGVNRKITVSAVRRGEIEPRTVDVVLKDARTENKVWVTQPDQQLVYHGARVWARRWTPGVMLGVYSPEEWKGDAVADAYTAGPTIESTAEAVPAAPIPPAAPYYRTVAELDAACAAQGKVRTSSQWLDALDAELNGAVTAAAVEEIQCRADVQKGLDVLKNGALTRLNAMVKAALDRTATGPADDEPDGEYGQREAAE